MIAITIVLLTLCTITVSFEFHVAPMVGYTNQHYRYLCRLLSPSSVLWSEMLKPSDVFNGNEEMLLTRGNELDLCSKITSRSSSSSSISSSVSSKCVIQIGDNNINNIRNLVKIINNYDYDQIDLNCGCPSVDTNAAYGASLMKKPNDIINIINNINDISNIPISIKCRIGVYDNNDNNYNNDNYNTLKSFISTITCNTNINNIVIHSRSAVLQGLSPSKNREVPPLRHDFVKQIAQDFNNINVIINGGYNKLDDVQLLLNDYHNNHHHLKGMMSGRWMLQNVFDLYNIDKVINNNTYYYRSLEMTMKTSIELYCEYADKMMSYYHHNQYQSILLPIMVMIESILVIQNENDNLAKELGTTLLESSLPLLSKAGYHINHDDIYDDDDDELISGFDKFRKYLVKVIGKKIASKLRSNVQETVSVS